jgi:hypothetical protein
MIDGVDPSLMIKTSQVIQPISSPQLRMTSPATISKKKKQDVIVDAITVVTGKL